jgi:hypothetical protein
MQLRDHQKSIARTDDPEVSPCHSSSLSLVLVDEVVAEPSAGLHSQQ